MSNTVTAIRQAAEQALSKLADMTPDEIAAYMTTLGIKGVCANASKCVIANYLNRATREAGAPAVATSSHGCTVLAEAESVRWVADDLYVAGGYYEPQAGVNWWTAVNHPPSVSDFIDHFDNKRYPELIAEAVRV